MPREPATGKCRTGPDLPSTGPCRSAYTHGPAPRVGISGTSGTVDGGAEGDGDLEGDGDRRGTARSGVPLRRIAPNAAGTAHATSATTATVRKARVQRVGG